jgi:predicted nucleic acid-binding protein
MAIEAGAAARLCFDTNALIYLLYRVSPYYEWLAPLFEGIKSGEKGADVSVVTEAEMLVRPLRGGDVTELDRIDAFFSYRSVHLWDVNRDIARASASVRAKTRLKLPDALIVATAIVSGSAALVGNDEMCARRVTEIPYIYLEEAVGRAL